MKTILMTAFVIFFAVQSVAQNSISNTKWKATLLIPQAVDVNFTFKKDTLYMTTESSEEVGKNFFIQRNDTLMIRKISGSSPCPEQSQGIYRIEWLKNGNKFRLHGISDECEGRIGVFTVNPFERIGDKQ
jgi:cell wall-associated protease